MRTCVNLAKGLDEDNWQRQQLDRAEAEAEKKGSTEDAGGPPHFTDKKQE